MSYADDQHIPLGRERWRGGGEGYWESLARAWRVRGRGAVGGVPPPHRRGRVAEPRDVPLHRVLHRHRVLDPAPGKRSRGADCGRYYVMLCYVMLCYIILYHSYRVLDPAPGVRSRAAQIMGYILYCIILYYIILYYIISFLSCAGRCSSRAIARARRRPHARPVRASTRAAQILGGGERGSE